MRCEEEEYGCGKAAGSQRAGVGGHHPVPHLQVPFASRTGQQRCMLLSAAVGAVLGWQAEADGPRALDTQD